MSNTPLLGFEGKRKTIDLGPRLLYGGGSSQRGHVETSLTPRLHFGTATITTSLDPDLLSKQDKLVAESRVREILPEDMRLSSEFIEALTRKVQELIEQAIARAEANGRKTLMPQDL